MSANDQLKTELEEFEALLNEGEAQNEPQLIQKIDSVQPSININSKRLVLFQSYSNSYQSPAK